MISIRPPSSRLVAITKLTLAFLVPTAIVLNQLITFRTAQLFIFSPIQDHLLIAIKAFARFFLGSVAA